MDKEETKTEESTGVYLYGPDVYVLSNIQNPKSAFELPQEYGETNQTDTPEMVKETKDNVPSDGPVCPQCGNVITDDMPFCPECGTQLHKQRR